jgi:hypothetical protein
MPVPTPTSGEERDKCVSRCISALKHSDPSRPDKQIQAICFDKWRSKGTKGVRGGDREGPRNRPLRQSVKYMMPFTLKEKANGKALIHGTAISAQTSRNGITYTVEGLKDNESLVNMNIGLGHSGNPADNIGRIIKSTWDDVSNSRKYQAEIFNTARYPDAIDMVEKGLWQFVSIEAIPKDAKYDKKNKSLIVNDLEFLGLDFVKSPGIRQASAAIAGESFGVALYEALDLEKKNILEELNMTEEEKNEEEKVEEQPVKEKTKNKIVEKVVYKTDPKVLELLESLTKEVKSLKEKAEEDEDEEEVEEKSKAVVTEETKEKPETNLIFEASGLPGMKSFWVMPSPDGELQEAV